MHILIIGGTGMLAAATRELATRSDRLTLVARTRRSLASVADGLPESLQVHLLALDWNDPEPFLDALRQHVARVGHPTVTLAWLHDDELGPRVARVVCSTETPSTFMQVHGSQASHRLSELPSKVEVGLGDFDYATDYRHVILGFIVEGGESRWLTHPEISAGVIAALDSGNPSVSIVGSVDRGSARPS